MKNEKIVAIIRKHNGMLEASVNVGFEVTTEKLHDIYKLFFPDKIYRFHDFLLDGVHVFRFETDAPREYVEKQTDLLYQIILGVTTGYNDFIKELEV